MTANDPAGRFAAAVAPDVAPGEFELVLRLSKLRSLAVEAVAPGGTPERDFGAELMESDARMVLSTVEEALRGDGRLVVELSAPDVSVRVRTRGYEDIFFEARSPVAPKKTSTSKWN